MLFQSFHSRAFLFLWLGQTISRLGDSLHRIALAWWVLEKTGSATTMGTVLIFSFAPMLIFLLIGGVAVDRLPRGRVMFASDILRGFIVAIVATLAFAQTLQVWHIYIASIVFGFVDAFFQPAYSAIVPEIVPRDALPSANALTSLSARITGVAGPALGASIVVFGGTPFAFAIDAATFFTSALCLIPIIRVATPAPEKSQNVLRDLREGLATVFASPWLWVTIGVFAIANVALDGPISVALAFLVKDYLQSDVGGLGVLYSMSSLGSILAALWLGRYKKIRRRGLLTYGAGILCGAMVFAIGLPITLVGASIAILIFGFTTSFFGLIWTNTLQEMVPRDLLGRVTSIDMLGSWVLLPMGYGLAGWLTDWIGAPNVFLIGGALGAGLVALGLLHPQVRGLD
jgi:DHA3 family tetracycline resistance protein-like MFS transporter